MVGIIDYGMGNLRSVANACEFLGKQVKFVRGAADLDDVDHLILPGVGSFAEGMRRLNAQGMARAIQEELPKRKIPLLGICLGMQLLANKGTEGGNTDGLGLINGEVVKLECGDLRVPHIGWNDVRICLGNPLLSSEMAVDYYFVHSYYFKASEPKDVIGVCDYGMTFPCVVGKGAIFGVQFHPEKSHRFGTKLLENFLRFTC